MAQFDVHANTALSKARVPFLLDVQSDLLTPLATRVVVPLVKPTEIGKKLIRGLHLEVSVQGHRFIAIVSELAAIPTKALGRRVTSLAGRRSDLVRALDLLITGV